MNSIGGNTNFSGSFTPSTDRNTSTTAAGQVANRETSTHVLQPRKEFIARIVSMANRTGAVQGAQYIGNGVLSNCHSHIASRIQPAQQAYIDSQPIEARNRYVASYVQQGRALGIPTDNREKLLQHLLQAGEHSWRMTVANEWDATDAKKDIVLSATIEWQNAVRQHAAQLADQLYGPSLPTLSSVPPQPGAKSRAAGLYASLNTETHSQAAGEKHALPDMPMQDNGDEDADGEEISPEEHALLKQQYPSTAAASSSSQR